MEEPIIQEAEAILQNAFEQDYEKAHQQVFTLQAMTNLTHEQAHAAFSVYAAELKKMADARGISPVELQKELGEQHCLVLLGMVAGGVHCNTHLCFGGMEAGGE